MPDNSNQLPQRKSPRASWLEYNDGDFFVTVCTKEKRHYFGEVVGDKMCLTDIGVCLENELRCANDHHPDVTVLCFVVMPNHFHAIVRISSGADATRRVPTVCAGVSDATRRVPTVCAGVSDATRRVPTRRNTVLASFMGQVKAAVTRYARQQGEDFGWQTRYHDHLVRGVSDGNNIARYIEGNVANWAKDCFYIE